VSSTCGVCWYNRPTAEHERQAWQAIKFVLRWIGRRILESHLAQLPAIFIASINALPAPNAL